MAPLYYASVYLACVSFGEINLDLTCTATQSSKAHSKAKEGKIHLGSKLVSCRAMNYKPTQYVMT